jgi:proteasome lid subunit RPN8/RPN11
MSPAHEPAAPREPGHPGPGTATLPGPIRAAIVEHALRDYPNEACGIVIGTAPAGDGGRALRFAPTRNAAASPYRYEIDSGDLLRLTLETDDADEAFWAIVHSHVRSPARPSPTDIGLALYPDALYVLVSLAETEADPITGEPGIRAWRILGGEVFEVELGP